MHNIKCIIVDDEPTARDILQFHIEQIKDIEIIGSCRNAIEAIEQLNSHNIDLIFLDINMPNMSGISLARTIPKSTKIIFTTAYREYAVDGFDLQAVDYLLKPISLERLVQAIQKYRLENNRNSLTNTFIKDYIIVRSERKMIKINFSDILYVESLSDYVKIHTLEKIIITRETITNIHSNLPVEFFIRIHRSFIISISYITSYTVEYVEVKEKSLPISRSYRSAFLNQMESD